ncbi:MAG TPA: Mur ligase family protein [bacterium]|nr:Mur ligase family protein [bacterium]
MKHLLSKDFFINLNKLGSSKFYFIGILGSGMSALAGFLRLKGARAEGSDRNYSTFQKNETALYLESIGCVIHNQKESHITPVADYAVVSTAIEPDNPDVKKSIEYNIPIIHRADLLAYLVNNNAGVAIAGTSGKSTTAGITGFLLKKCGLPVNIITGAAIKNIEENKEPLNCIAGDSGIFVVETDESDGSIVKFKPAVSALTNISKDHKTIEELLPLFQEFINNTKEKVFINKDDKLSMRLNFKNINAVFIGSNDKCDYAISDLKESKDGTEFKLNGKSFEINIPGIYNVYNSAFAIAVAEHFGIQYDKIREALKKFEGVADRFDFVRKQNPLIAFDYAHNPAKINSLLQFVIKFYGKTLFIYQPHGFQPTFFLKNELSAVFENYFIGGNKIILKPIFYAGGSADKKISSEEIVKELKSKEINAEFAPDDSFIIDYISHNKNLFDAIIIAGARDKNLKSLCEKINSLF